MAKEPERATCPDCGALMFDASRSPSARTFVSCGLHEIGSRSCLQRQVNQLSQRVKVYIFYGIMGPCLHFSPGPPRVDERSVPGHPRCSSEEKIRSWLQQHPEYELAGVDGLEYHER